MAESLETRMARLEEAMVSVKGDTRYLRDNFDSFKREYWLELVKASGKMAGVSAFTSLFVAAATVMIARALWP